MLAYLQHTDTKVRINTQNKVALMVTSHGYKQPLYLSNSLK